jgi:serine/threonine-protein kinase
VPNPAPGTILGAYRVEGTIGQGSMGEVFRAIDTGLNRKVAIKILSDKHRDSSELRARFVREGRAVAAISHPNVVQVFATGSFDERPYIAMELLDGTDLGSAVEKQGPLGSVAAANVILDAAQGLHAAAKAGLIHRDVKPSNLVRLSDGRVKVTDFGLAKPVDPGHEPALTAMGVVVGTPDYIAPEQARGDAIDERVDIYALGGTLYYLLTGVPPFRTGKPAEDKYLKVVARHLRNPPPDATERRPDTDRELAALARVLMSKKPDERPSYSDVIEQVSLILSRLDPDAIPELISRSRDRSRPFRLPVDPRAAAPEGGAALASTPPPAARTSGLSPAAPAPSQPSASQPAIAPAPSTPTLPPDLTTRDDRPPAALSEPSIVPVPRGFPAWLALLTLASVGVFVAGLAVYLRAGTAAGTPATTPGSAGAVTAASGPAGMVLIAHPDGKPWMWVDPRPVSVAAYRAVFANHDQGGAAADASVVGVTVDQAKAFAHGRGGRLLTGAEWDAAVLSPQVAVDNALVEWVDEPVKDGKRPVRARGLHETRLDKPQPDVTFRVARDP